MCFICAHLWLIDMPITHQQVNAIRRSLGKYSDDVAGRMLDDLVGGIKKSVESLINPTEDARGAEVGLNPATARNAIQDILRRHSAEGLLDDGRIDFALTTARDVAAGAGTFVKEAADPEVVEAYPAWELVRVYDRDVPRGYRRAGQTLIPVPGDDWPARWRAAGGELINGRMIALKSDAIWQRLGDGVGGYTDTLGNPFPPFAFNSGYDVNNIGRAETIELGLLQPGEMAAPASVDLNNLFAPIEEAA